MNDREVRRFLEARLEVPAVHADAVCNYIIDNITSGLVLEEEEDSATTGIIFYIPEEASGTYREPFEDYLRQLVRQDGFEFSNIRERYIKDVDWIEQYRESVRPVAIDDKIIVRPAWSTPDRPYTYDIVIEPKMAFGTGSHETTQSCLRTLQTNFKAGMRFLDLGCGSGVLSILADKMGAAYIKAIDYDVTAVDNCRENFEVNRVRTPNDILFGSIEKTEGDEPYHVVCVNIIKSTILPILSRLVELTKEDGILILSGLLEEDRNEINAALAALDQTDYDIDQFNKWLTYTTRRK